jgi:hypothetical protein
MREGRGATCHGKMAEDSTGSEASDASFICKGQKGKQETLPLPLPKETLVGTSQQQP